MVRRTIVKISLEVYILTSYNVYKLNKSALKSKNFFIILQKNDHKHRNFWIASFLICLINHNLFSNQRLLSILYAFLIVPITILHKNQYYKKEKLFIGLFCHKRSVESGGFHGVTNFHKAKNHRLSKFKSIPQRKPGPLMSTKPVFLLKHYLKIINLIYLTS